MADVTSWLPCNLYGPNDNFDLSTSHVLPALIRTGTPLREFLHVDDLARGVVFCLDTYDESDHINCGAGQETSIRKLAELVARVVGVFGRDRVRRQQARRDAAQAHGFTPHCGAGSKPEISLDTGIADAYRWFLGDRMPSLEIGERFPLDMRRLHMFLADGGIVTAMLCRVYENYQQGPAACREPAKDAEAASAKASRR